MCSTIMSLSGPASSRAAFSTEDRRAAAGSLYVARADFERWKLPEKIRVVLSDDASKLPRGLVTLQLDYVRPRKRTVEFGAGTSTLFVRRRSKLARSQVLYVGISSGSPTRRKRSRGAVSNRDRDPRPEPRAEDNPLRPLDADFVIRFTRQAVTQADGGILASRHVWELLAESAGFSPDLDQVDGIRRDQLYRLIRRAVPGLPRALRPRRLGGPRGPEKHWEGYTLKKVSTAITDERTMK